MEKEELSLKIGELAKLVLRLGNAKITNEYEAKISSLEQALNTEKDEKVLDMIREDYNRLAKSINDEIEHEKKWRS